MIGPTRYSDWSFQHAKMYILHLASISVSLFQSTTQSNIIISSWKNYSFKIVRFYAYQKPNISCNYEITSKPFQCFFISSPCSSSSAVTHHIDFVCALVYSKSSSNYSTPNWNMRIVVEMEWETTKISTKKKETSSMSILSLHCKYTSVYFGKLIKLKPFFIFPLAGC